MSSSSASPRRRGVSERTRGLREARALLSRSKPSLPGRAVGPAVPDLPGFPQAAPEPHTPPQSYLWPRHIGVPCVSAGTPAHSSCRRERPSTAFGVFIVSRTGKSSATASVAAFEKRLRQPANRPAPLFSWAEPVKSAGRGTQSRRGLPGSLRQGPRRAAGLTGCVSAEPSARGQKQCMPTKWCSPSC